jgi:hypothetical protein
VHDSSGNFYMMTAAHCADTGGGTLANGITFYNGWDTPTAPGTVIGNISFVGGTIDGKHSDGSGGVIARCVA